MVEGRNVTACFPEDASRQYLQKFKPASLFAANVYVCQMFHKYSYVALYFDVSLPAEGDSDERINILTRFSLL